MASKKYCEYFDVNEAYFPCIDESAIMPVLRGNRPILMKLLLNC